jgi:predicted site-specific integrase-resolvase
VSVETLRKWEKTGELLPDRKTKGGTRFYDAAKLLALGDGDSPTVCYARVSSSDQKSDLDRQQTMLETYCAAKGWKSEVIKLMTALTEEGNKTDISSWRGNLASLVLLFEETKRDVEL